MRISNWLRLASATALFSVAAPAPAADRSQRDSGLSATYPWSGFWWPLKSGGLGEPLAKYDAVAGTHAASWERDNHSPPGAEIPTWFGHCHAWSASSVQEREPRGPRQVGPVSFGVGDQKGLLAALHAQDVSNSYGQRFDEGGTAEARDDLRPDELWRILQLYIRRQKLPLVLDLEAGPQVWNYPIYQYDVTYQVGSDGSCDGVMQLLAADNNVQPDFVGTQYTVHRYTFRAQFRGGALVSGSSQWTGRSVQDHPDFAWYPYVAVAENPDVDAEKVSKILGYKVADPRTPGSADDRGVEVTPPPPPTTPTPTPTRPDETTRPVEPVALADALDPYRLATLIADKVSRFSLDVVVDRGDGGKYQPGEPIKLSIRSGEPGFLYLFDIDREGKIRLVFPRLGEPNRLDAKLLYDLPAAGGQPLLLAEGTGQHDLKAIVTDRPLDLPGFRQAPRRQAQQQQPPKQRQGKDAGPEPITLPPSTEAQVRREVVEGLHKANVVRPDKAFPFEFAQDICAYYVFPASSK